MTIEAATNPHLAADAAATGPIIHPRWVRVTHWINALAMLMMIGSGWQIYDASPLFGFEFPRQIALGNWLAGALLWHFAAMWLLVINGLVYVTLGIVTGRFRRKLFRSVQARFFTISLPRSRHRERPPRRSSPPMTPRASRAMRATMPLRSSCIPAT